MARIEQMPTVGMEIRLLLGEAEAEAEALVAMAGYGVDAFIQAFYKEMGRHYMQPHEKGLRSLLTAAGAIAPHLESLKRARQAFLTPTPAAKETSETNPEARGNPHRHGAPS